MANQKEAYHDAGGKKIKLQRFPDPTLPFLHVRLFKSSRSRGWALLIAAALMIFPPKAVMTATAQILKTQVAGPLKLSPPRASPPGIPPSPSGAKTPVVFRTLVTGTPTPPSILCLDEVSRNGDLLTRGITALLDDGEGADTLAGDGFYAATLPIGHPRPTEKFYRLGNAVLDKNKTRKEAEDVCKNDSGKMVTSGIVTFPITPQPLEARPPRTPIFVHDPESKARYVANELVLVARGGTSISRILSMVDDVRNSGAVPGAEIVLCLPALNIYSITFGGDPTADAVKNAIRVFSSRYEVESASRNYEVLNALPDFPNDERYTAGGRGQWYLRSRGIDADAAWAQYDRVSKPVNVAVIDYGIDFRHEDLKGKSISASGLCDPTTVSAHGTWVAGPIAANTDNSVGIAGVAWKAGLLSCHMNTGAADDLLAAIDAALRNEARILNFSNTTSPTAAVEKAVCDAVCAGRLVVAAAGNQGKTTCPPLEEKAPSYYNRNQPCTCSTTFSITAFSEGNPNDGMVTVVSAGHGLGNEDQIDISGTTLYNGTYTITEVTPDTFDITAGWGGTETGAWAQRYIMQDAILAVGALDKEERAAWGMETGDDANCSNHGPWIDLWAPGKTILTTDLTTDQPDTYVEKGGTSLAASIASGAAAVVWAIHPAWRHTEVERRLRTTAGAVNKNASDYASHPYFGKFTDPDQRGRELNNRLQGGRLDLGGAVVDSRVPITLRIIGPR